MHPSSRLGVVLSHFQVGSHPNRVVRVISKVLDDATRLMPRQQAISRLQISAGSVKEGGRFLGLLAVTVALGAIPRPIAMGGLDPQEAHQVTTTPPASRQTTPSDHRGWFRVVSKIWAPTPSTTALGRWALGALSRVALLIV